MTKRRPSIRGRGAEILRGQPPPGDTAAPSDGDGNGPDVSVERALHDEAQDAALDTAVGPGAGSEAVVPAVSAETAAAATELPVVLLPPPPDDGVESGLYEEARDAVDDAGEGEDQPEQAEPPVTPEIEAAFVAEAFAAEETPDPIAETPVPSLEPTMEEEEMRDDAVLFEPPPPETASDAGSGVLPPRPERPGLALEFAQPTAVAADVQGGDGRRVEPAELTRELTEEEQRRLLARLGSARLSKLDREIDRTYSQVLEVVGDNGDLATENYNLLLKARDIVWRREAARIAQAEYYVEQVQARLQRAADSQKGARRYAWRITGWGGVWALVLVVLLILLSYDWFRNAVAPPAAGGSQIDMSIFVPAMVWGGLGGVVAVWYSLFKHVGQRDFDTAFNLSYVGKPFMGLVLGAVVYMLFHLLILTVGIIPAGLTGEAGAESPTLAPWIIYLLSFASGFKENRVFDLIDRVMKQIFSSGESATPAPGPEGPAPAG